MDRATKNPKLHLEMWLIGLLLATYGVLTTSAAYENVPHLCKGVKRTTKRYPSIRCDAYIECSAEMAFVRLCALGTEYNRTSTRCDTPLQHECAEQIYKIHLHQEKDLPRITYLLENILHMSEKKINEVVFPGEGYSEGDVTKPSNGSQPYPAQSNAGKPRNVRSISFQNDQDQNGQYFTDDSLVHAQEGSLTHEATQPMMTQNVQQVPENQHVDHQTNQQTLYQSLPQTYHNQEATQGVQHQQQSQVQFPRVYKQGLQQKPSYQGRRPAFIPKARSFLPAVSSRPFRSQGTQTFNTPSYGRYDTKFAPSSSSGYGSSFPDSSSTYGNGPNSYKSNDEKAMMQMFEKLKTRTKSESDNYVRDPSSFVIPETESKSDSYSGDSFPSGKSLFLDTFGKKSDKYSFDSGFGDSRDSDFSDKEYKQDYSDEYKDSGLNPSGFGGSSSDESYFDSDFFKKNDFKSYDYDSPKDGGAKRGDRESYYSGMSDSDQRGGRSSESYNGYGNYPDLDHDRKQSYQSQPSSYDSPGYDSDRDYGYSDGSNNGYGYGDQATKNYNQEDNPPPTTTPTPIWIHPFARGGSAFPKKTKSEDDNSGYGHTDRDDYNSYGGNPRRSYQGSSHDNNDDDSYYSKRNQGYDNSGRSYGTTDSDYDSDSYSKPDDDSSYYKRNSYGKSGDDYNPRRKFKYGNSRRSYDSSYQKKNPEYYSSGKSNDYNTPPDYHNQDSDDSNRYSQNQYEQPSYSNTGNRYSNSQSQDRDGHSERYQPRHERNDKQSSSYPSAQRGYSDNYKNNEDYPSNDRQRNDQGKSYSDADPYTDPKNRERSSSPSNPDSYYNAKNPGPWGAAPPFPTDTRGQGGSTMGGGGGGDGGGGGYGGEEGPEGEHEHQGRKPPDFGTFPFNFMPKHLTGPLFTNQGDESFSEHANFGHVGKLGLDENGEVQYDYSENRIPPVKKPNASESVEGKKGKLESNEETGASAAENTDYDDIKNGSQAKTKTPSTNELSTAAPMKNRPTHKQVDELQEKLKKSKGLSGSSELEKKAIQKPVTKAPRKDQKPSTTPKPSTEVSLESAKTSGKAEPTTSVLATTLPPKTTHPPLTSTTTTPAMFVVESGAFETYPSEPLDGFVSSSLHEVPESDEAMVVASTNPSSPAVSQQEEFITASDSLNLRHPFFKRLNKRTRRSTDYFGDGDSSFSFPNFEHNQRAGSFDPYGMKSMYGIDGNPYHETLTSGDSFRKGSIDNTFAAPSPKELSYPAPPKEYEFYMMGRIPKIDNYRTQKQMFLATIHLDEGKNLPNPEPLISGKNAQPDNHASGIYDSSYKPYGESSNHFNFEPQWLEYDTSIEKLYGGDERVADEGNLPFVQPETPVSGKNFQSSKWNSQSAWK